MLMLVAAGVALLAGQYWLIAAMRTGEIAVVAPFRYSIILWAVALGLHRLGRDARPRTWIGIAIVTLAGIYTFLREQQLAGMAKAMTDNLRGILAVLVGSTAFVLNDAMVKLVSAELPSGEIIILRGMLATAMLMAGVACWAPAPALDPVRRR